MSVQIVSSQGTKEFKPQTKGEETILFSSFQYYIVPSLYILAYFGISNPYMMVFIAYSLIPYLDNYFSYDIRNPTKEEQKQLSGQFKYKLPLYASVLCEWIFQTWIVYYISVNKDNISLFNQIGIIFISGNGSASNINVAHELMHKSGLFDKFLGTFTLAKNLYMHFEIEHQYGHHKNVATLDDPATSRKDQSLYQYLPQTIFGSYFSAWKIENNFQRRKGRNAINIKNKMVLYNILYILIPLFYYMIFGLYAMCFFLTTASISVIYLEAINYVEHYGLLRNKTEDGLYEKVDIRHSWNSPHRFSNYLLFKLQRHSDHHENGYKEYQTLCSYEDSPTLPHGYPVCILLSVYPPLWFDIMNEVLQSYNTHKKSIFIQSVQDKIDAYTKKVSLLTFTLVLLSFVL